MSRLERAAQLVADCKDAMAAARLGKVIVTDDPNHFTAGYDEGCIVVVAPKLTFSTWDEIEETWTLHIAAGPLDNFRVAWQRLDDILTALHEAHINLDSADPSSIAIADGEPPLPGYVVTLTPDPVST